jgi:hypothetical protein
MAAHGMPVYAINYAAKSKKLRCSFGRTKTAVRGVLRGVPIFVNLLLITTEICICSSGFESVVVRGTLRLVRQSLWLAISISSYGHVKTDVTAGTAAPLRMLCYAKFETNGAVENIAL